MALLVMLGLNVPLWLLDAVFLCLHCLLCARGLTTYEFMRGMQNTPSRRRSRNRDNIQGGFRAVQFAKGRSVHAGQVPVTSPINTAAVRCSQRRDEESNIMPNS